MKLLTPTIWSPDKVDNTTPHELAEQAIHAAHKTVSRLQHSPEVINVLTKLQEAQHWLAADQAANNR